MSSQTYQRITEETLEEHRQIHFYLDQILVALKGLRDDLQDVEPMRRLAAQIESLRERLVEHQQAEEQGGMYTAILEALPEARGRVARLRGQHERVVEILELARIHAQFGKPAEAKDLREDLERFLQMIRDHERDDEDLLEQAIAREQRSKA